MRTVVLKDVCIGCGLCPDITELYKMDDDGKAIAVKEPSSDEEKDLAHEAAEACPVDAITVED